MDDLFRGKLVRLAADEPETIGKTFVKWNRNSEYRRLMDTEPLVFWSAKSIKEWLEKDLEKEAPDQCFFNIHTLEGDQLIGFVALQSIRWSQGEAWVGIGETGYWGRGYGTDSMRLALRYAFMELSLERVSLNVCISSERAVRLYEKAGFKAEGVERRVARRVGMAEDVLYMGILRQEWVALYGGGENNAGA